MKVLEASGRFILFEKAVHPGRRVLFQRALEARECVPIAEPQLLTYSELGEPVEDGPLYVVRRGPVSLGAEFREDVRQDSQQGIYRCQGARAEFVYARLPKCDVRSEVVKMNLVEQDGRCETGQTCGGLGYVRLMLHGTFSGLLLGAMEWQPLMVELVRHALRQGRESIETRLTRIWSEPESGPLEDSPLYENHTLTAEEVWRQLPDRVILRQQTDEAADGRERHIEYGRCDGNFHYLYWANTFDQRQIVIMDRERSALLETYYSEAIGEV